MPALDGASVTAAVFHPSSRVLVVGTASNQLHVLDVEAKTLGDWSKKYGSQLPKEFLEFPGGLSGLSMPSWMDTTSLIVYSPRYGTTLYSGTALPPLRCSPHLTLDRRAELCAKLTSASP